MLSAIAEAIYKIKLYPDDSDLELVTEALMGKYPCLIMKCGAEGWELWKPKLA